MTSAVPACEACPAHSLANLVKLGVDMDNWDYVIALAGNPNTGKSTVFNALTGLRQRTGNWPGKTVTRAEGGFVSGNDRYKLVDLPGTYSLLSSSFDEEIARDFILFGQPDVTVIVVDATRLERNLNFVLQVLEVTDRVVVCLNLIDEARRRGITIDERRLARDLGVPVVPAAARYRQGLAALTRAIAEVGSGEIVCRPERLASAPSELRRAVERFAPEVDRAYPGLPNIDWITQRLLDGDERVTAAFQSGELETIWHGQSEAPSADALLLDARTLRRESPAHDAPPLEGTVLKGTVREGTVREGTVREDAATAHRATVLAAIANARQRLGPHAYESLTESVHAKAARIADRSVTRPGQSPRFDLERTIDRLVTSRRFGIPLMVMLLIVVFWITIAGANTPSKLLGSLLIDTIHPALKGAAASAGVPAWLSGVTIDGMYLATAWVITVMLPPMAIFFPLFTLLEDLGYLPRVAFNLDSRFRRVGADGKQSLTMAMGFGCNAAGVISTRIIKSPRERLIAILTNNFSLCNGRWPLQILIASIFLGSLVPAYLGGLVSAVAVVAVAVLGVGLTLLVSWVLSRSVLRGEVSAFSLELPPYRPPRILQTLYTSLIDRTMFVLWRAIVFAVPAGAAIWLISNIDVAGVSLAQHAVEWLDPFGIMLGLSGIILLAYIVAIPANEIVIPTILMLTVLVTGAVGFGEGAGVMFALDSNATAELLKGSGWTVLMAVNLMLFSLVHNPCSTTIYTIWKETRSVKWTAVAVLLPLGLGIVLCFLVAQIWRLIV